jgi:hypothetical protein
VTGQDFFRCYKYHEGELVLVSSVLGSELNSTDYRCATWTVEGNLLIGNDIGEIVVVSQELQ